MIAPGATIGIIGAGQLGKMMSLAALPLGYRCMFFSPQDDAPGLHTTPHATIASYDDLNAMKEFLSKCDVASFEFEHIPEATLLFLETQTICPILPNPNALRIAQNRLKEKQLCIDLNLPTAQYRAITDSTSFIQALETIGTPCICKTVTEGYDGKGQMRITNVDTHFDYLCTTLGFTPSQQHPVIMEAFIPFDLECSVILSRNIAGQIVFFPLSANNHDHGILTNCMVPAPISHQLEQQMIAAATSIANTIGYVGTLAVEFFVSHAGQIWINECAPRPHNSGHWSIEACMMSQFEAHIRAICGMPFGSTKLRCHTAQMRNLIGEDVACWETLIQNPQAHLHLYGKEYTRPGRKMGHVTFIDATNAP